MAIDERQHRLQRIEVHPRTHLPRPHELADNVGIVGEQIAVGRAADANGLAVDPYAFAAIGAGDTGEKQRLGRARRCGGGVGRNERTRGEGRRLK